MEQRVVKTYVTVTAKIREDGSIRPLIIQLADGRQYEIDEIKNVCRAASRKAGGCGMRYTIRIGSRDTYLFDEDGRWFVEMNAAHA